MTETPPPSQGRCLVVMVRYPEPGQVKTRLARSCGDAFAAELYGYFVDDLLEAVAAGNHALEVAFLPDGRETEIRRRFGDRFSYSPQRGEDLGERMENAFRFCFAKGFSRVVLIGSDVPDLTAEVIEEAFQALESKTETVIGPSYDGGYYLIGFRSASFVSALFSGIRWGEEIVFAQTAHRLRERGVPLHLVQTWHDIDTARDLAGLQARHRHTPFGRSRTMVFLQNRSEAPPTEEREFGTTPRNLPG